VSHSLQNWLVALGIIVGAGVVGFAIDAIVVGLLGHGNGPGTRVRGAMARALRGQPEIWAILVATALFRPFDFLYARTPLWIDRLTVLLAVLSVTMFAARLAGWLIRAYLSKDTVAAPGGSIFANLARMIIWAVGLTIMLGALKVEIGPLVASLGVAGLAVSLGLQDTIANFFSGLQITTSRQIQPGQYIRLSTAEEGTVLDVTWRNTTLRSPSNDLVIVPNSVIARSQITNFTANSEEHTVAIPFTIAYGSDLDRIKEVAAAVATEVRDELDGAVKDFEPACRFRALGADGVSAAVTIRVERYQERLPIVSELVQRLHARFAEAGIEFASGAAATPEKPA
jgi:small-conductance mechanosensitive channel